jgi:hypothetical protein
MKNFFKQISILLIIGLLTNPVFAEGFFGKLFGSDDSTESFGTLISHVPADTSFLFTNQKAIPEDVMSFHIERSQTLFETLSKASNQSFKKSKKVENSNKPKKDKTKIAEASNKTPSDFFSAFFADLGEHFKQKKLTETGLSLKSNLVIYGVDLTPVMRLSITDKEKLMVTLKRAEEKSGYKLSLAKCGDFDCMVDTAKDDMSMALVLLNKQLVASIFPTDKKDKILKHLIGKIPSNDAYKADDWQKFLTENFYTGHGEGFINLKNLYEKGSPLLVKELLKDKHVSNEEVKKCLPVVEDHLKNMPMLMFGTKELSAKKMNYEFVLKTSEEVSDVLQGIANKVNIKQRVDNAIFDVGLNFNIVKLREALTQYSDFLIKSAATHQCKNISAKDIRKAMGGLLMSMNMGMSQIKTLYVALNNIELKKNMQIEKIAAYVSIGTDDPAGLFNMVTLFSPVLRNFKIPADGTSIKLPNGALPIPKIELPPIWINRSERTLNLLVGANTFNLKEYFSGPPAMFIMAMNSKRYYEKLSTFLDSIKRSKTSEPGIKEMMSAIGNNAGNIQQEIYADKRGLAFNYHIQYGDAEENAKNTSSDK